eukprot:g70666.t1
MNGDRKSRGGSKSPREDLTLQLFERIEDQPLTLDGWEQLLSGWLPKASEPVLKSYAQTFLDHDITTVETLTYLENRDMADLKIAPVHRPLIAAAAADLMHPHEDNDNIQFHSSPAVSRTFGLKQEPGGTLQEVMSKELWQSAAAEFISTLFFLYLTVAAVLYYPALSEAVVVGVSYGLLHWLFFPISGGQQAPAPHMNPILTLIAVCTAAITPVRFLLYILAQLGGAAAGGALAVAMDPSSFDSNDFVYSYKTTALYEIVFGILLALLVMHLRLENLLKSKDRVLYDPLLSISLSLFFFLNASMQSGALINPMWAFGVAVALDTWQDHWVFWVPSLLSAVAGLLLHALLTKRVFLRDRRL